MIPRRLPACALCWRRLPPRFRDAISGRDRTRWATWSDAVIAADRWFLHHPIARRLRARA